MKVIAFSTGNSRSSETWSNVPYFFLSAWEQSGAEVVRVDIRPFARQRWLRVLVNRYLKLTGQPAGFERTKLFARLAKKKMLKAVRRHPDADLLMSFDFSNCIEKETGIPSLLLCDWDLEYLIRRIDRREPTKQEKALMEAQRETVNSASYAVTIFPNAFEEMKARYPRLAYFGTPVNLAAPPFDCEAAIEKRRSSRRLLFIGKKKYLSGARALAGAVERFNARAAVPFTVDLIGMEQSDTGIESRFVTHYGYLRKDEKNEWRTYCSLLESAYFFINTTENWVGASSVLDTAYLGIPCIINPNPDLMNTLGGALAFGFCCEENTAQALEAMLEKIDAMSDEEYVALSRKARETVEAYTYPALIKKITAMITK